MKKLLTISSLPQQWKTRSLEQDSNPVQLDELGEKHTCVMPSEKLVARFLYVQKGCHRVRQLCKMPRRSERDIKSLSMPTIRVEKEKRKIIPEQVSPL